ncbi:MAG TPA: hypothetical protein VNH22_06385 [Blastocatellia bacterium]|jgi:hypothetical protein|nr:hypothetical protein [Blastocatellia bacterium]
MLETRNEVSITDIERPRAGKSRAARWAVVMACLAVSALAAVPFFFITKVAPGTEDVAIEMPTTHDMHLHFEQMKSFYRGLSDGEIYPRWEEDTNRGFGAPTTSYYPPGIYYLTSAFFLITQDWWWGLLGTHWALMLASAAAIYIYARRVMSRAAAAVAMIAYTLLPYHIVDQYQRGALAELLGFIWMPLMMLFGEGIFTAVADWRESRPERRRLLTSPEGSRALLNAGGLAATYGAFIWSHPPTAYQFALAFGLYTVTLALARRDMRGLIATGCAMILGGALSAAYLLPAAMEQELIRHEYVSDVWPYHGSYIFVHALPYSQGHRGFFDLLDAIWIFGAVSLAIASLALLFRKPRAESYTPALKRGVLLWLVLGAFACFMTVKISEPLGRLIPKIDIGVFTWRMLSIATLATALMAGACMQAAISAWRERRIATLLPFGLLSLLIAVGGAVFSTIAVAGPMFRSSAFVPSLEHVNLATIPRTAFEDPLELPFVPKIRFENEHGTVSIDRWDSEHREFEVRLDSPDRVLVRTFNFPGWTATREGEAIPILTGEELGDIVLELPAGAHRIRLDYLTTPPRRAGNSISIISLCVLMVTLAYAFSARLRKRTAP